MVNNIREIAFMVNLFMMTNRNDEEFIYITTASRNALVNASNSAAFRATFKAQQNSIKECYQVIACSNAVSENRSPSRAK
jgi:hypothetical protein